MKTFAKTMRTILIVLAVVMLAIALFFYYVATPVVEEGQEPTLPQKIILFGKEKLNEILTLTGASMVGLLAYFTKRIYDSVKKSVSQALNTDANMQNISTTINGQRDIIKQQGEMISILTQKLDILSNVLMTTFSLSELPSNLREMIYTGQDQYNKLGTGKKISEQVVEALQNAEEEPAVAVEGETPAVQPDTEKETKTGPDYVG